MDQLALVQLLWEALTRLPDHRVVVDDDARARAVDALTRNGGGLLLEDDDGVLSARLVDREDEATSVAAKLAAADVVVRIQGHTYGVMYDHEDGQR